MKKVAVILSGCGVFDGAEIHESVLTLLAIEANGASYQCFAPDINQMHVVNHLTGEVDENDTRNVLVESARIARGNIKPTTELNASDFDALILPGGFGAAKNLSNFAVAGNNCIVEESVVKCCQHFASENKPIGYMCIAPSMIPYIHGSGVELTIGNDKDTAEAIEKMGGVHQTCPVKEYIIDSSTNIVSTPAYMLAGSISDAAKGINKTVAKVLSLTETK